MHKSILLFFLIAQFSTFSQIEEVRRITEKLCSEEFHGRGYVNKGDSLAADFIASEFKKIDVQPFSDSYFQKYSINQVNSFPNEMFIAFGESVLTPGVDYIIDPSCPQINKTLNPKFLGINDILDQKKFTEIIQDVITGKEYDAIALDLTNLSGDTLKELRSLPRSLAEYLPVIEITDQKFTWSVGREQIPNLLIQMIPEAFEQDEPIQVNIDADLIQNYTTQNVVAYIPGKKCKKTIVFTAHYDHLGRMGKDTYFPGANDNASGTAMLISMAKHLKEHPVDYNVVFIAFSGEEAGLLGSKYFTENPLIKLSKIKFLVNLDIMGSGEEGITVVNSTLFEKEYNLLVDINENNDLLEKVKKRGPAANSDHYWFTENGVPSFFIYTMGPNKHYHDVFDTYDELSFNEYNDITTLLLEFLKQL